MREIWKFPVTAGEVTADVQQWLKLDYDPQGIPCVWAVVDPQGEEKYFDIIRIGTGWPLENNEVNGIYLGSINDGPYVWHFFAKERILEKERIHAYEKDAEVASSNIGQALEQLGIRFKQHVAAPVYA